MKINRNKAINAFIKLSCLFVFSCFLLSCNSKKKYLDSTLDIMEEHALYSDKIDWDKIKEDSYKQLTHANNIEDVHAIIKESFRYLKDDGHSFLMSVNKHKAMGTSESSIPVIKSELLNDNIGYIKIPGFVGTPKMAHDFAKELQEGIKILDRSSLKGWIVDLSENTGGNMWPMILGISPILEDGTYGYFLDSKENIVPWSCKDGQVYIGDNSLLKLEDPYIVQNENKKIAVITGKRTASSGEATLVSFIGKKDTKLFGLATAGFTTGNQSFILRDGAQLYLTTTVFVDRNKKPYGNDIKPDIATFKPIEDATVWIMNQ
tara:strand:+ start:27 stop:983 length:957 start_codon:yes stop_codon:yes gene_type:complete